MDKQKNLPIRKALLLTFILLKTPTKPDFSPYFDTSIFHPSQLRIGTIWVVCKGSCCSFISLLFKFRY